MGRALGGKLAVDASGNVSITARGGVVKTTEAAPVFGDPWTAVRLSDLTANVGGDGPFVDTLTEVSPGLFEVTFLGSPSAGSTSIRDIDRYSFALPSFVDNDDAVILRVRPEPGNFPLAGTRSSVGVAITTDPTDNGTSAAAFGILIEDRAAGNARVYSVQQSVGGVFLGGYSDLDSTSFMMWPDDTEWGIYYGQAIDETAGDLDTFTNFSGASFSTRYGILLFGGDGGFAGGATLQFRADYRRIRLTNI